MQFKKIVSFASCIMIFASACSAQQKAGQYDVIVYGGTAAGVVAAAQVAQKGKSVLLIEPGTRLGGLTTGGLGDTDAGNEKAIGGMARAYYKDIAAKYGEEQARWKFEARVALEVFEDWVKKYAITVVYKERLDLSLGVIKKKNRIEALQMESGKIYRGKIFIDASYEGDVMAKAKVNYTTGREGNKKYGESLNGIHGGDEMNELPDGIDPYVIKGDPSSGLLRRVNRSNGGKKGDGDDKVQAYNFRMCLTNNPANRIPVEKPDGYIESDYEILFRAIEQGQKRRFFKLALVSADKTDSNNDSGISTDYIGMNYSYPEAGYQLRDSIQKTHEVYQRGLVWTLQNHPRIPEDVKAFYRPWGWPKDEFLDNNHFPSQLYIRESRRMVSDYVITEQVVLNQRSVADPVGMGSYAMDSHHTQYYVNEKGVVSTEGGFYRKLKKPYPVSYKAIVPTKKECANLLVPVCLSASHAAYGSVRMEPVFMILGQSAALAAVLSIDQHCAVQDLRYDLLHKELETANQTLKIE